MEENNTIDSANLEENPAEITLIESDSVKLDKKNIKKLKKMSKKITEKEKKEKAKQKEKQAVIV